MAETTTWRDVADCRYAQLLVADFFAQSVYGIADERANVCALLDASIPTETEANARACMRIIEAY